MMQRLLNQSEVAKIDAKFHDNALYQCNDDSVTGTWDSTKWDAVTLGEVSGNIDYLTVQNGMVCAVFEA